MTHRQPHLDDICGMWMIRRYVSGFGDAEYDFIGANTPHEQAPDTEDRIHVGVGRGRFDEHKGDTDECATTLVFKWIKEQADMPEKELLALRRIADWVFAEDTGRHFGIEHREFTVSPILLGHYYVTKQDSKAVVELGMTMLDAVLDAYKDLVRLDSDWEGRTEFDSAYGKAVALKTSARGVANYAYRKGFELAVFVNKGATYHNIRASAASGIDLTPTHEKLAEADPGAAWYFHHSKKMLICGSDKAPGTTPSRLSLGELTELLK